MTRAGAGVEPVAVDAGDEHAWGSPVRGSSGRGGGQLGGQHQRCGAEGDLDRLIGDGDVLGAQLHDPYGADPEHQHESGSELRVRVDADVGGHVGEEPPAFVLADPQRVETR